MTDNMGRGILAPRSNSQIQDGAREMRTLGRTTAAAISDLDRQVNGRVGQVENLSGVNRNDIAAWRQATAEIQNKIDQIEQNLEPGEDGNDGDPGPPGPGGSIALEETDPGCFVDSEITWMQWPQSGGLPAVWNPNTQAYENPIRVDTSVGTRVFVGDTMIYGDTGWRDLTPYLAEHVTPSTNLPEARLKRVNNRVYVEMKVDLSGSFSGSTLATLPLGFRTYGYRYLAVPFVGDGTGLAASNLSPFPGIGYTPATGQIQTPSSRTFTPNSTVAWVFDFDVTGRPWPTSLPGTPV